MSTRIITIQYDSLEHESGKTVLFGMEAGLPIHYILGARALDDKETKLAFSILKLAEPGPVRLELVIDNDTNEVIQVRLIRPHQNDTLP